MFNVSSQLYEELAARLRDAIAHDNYFSGSIAFPFDNADCKLTASLVIYRRRLELPDGLFDTIADVVPVWWEFSTVRDGVTLLNDFSFSELKEFLL